MGPVWLDMHAEQIDNEEKEILAHPSVGGVILFARNYHDSAQLRALTQSIRVAAGREILIGVDQEGGRVQRFRDAFTPIPAAQSYHALGASPDIAQQAGWLMAAELISHGIDLSFAPVLDLGFGCAAIKDRAFGAEKEAVTQYARAFSLGMRRAGMATTGKHFPGHGAVQEDSHLVTPQDTRDILQSSDFAIFKAFIEQGLLDAVMPAHVIYPQHDTLPASGSPYWLTRILRHQLGFEGIIFSDDLSMGGAHVFGDAPSRAKAALDAGCDMALICNDRPSAVSVLDALPIESVPVADTLRVRQSIDWQALKRDAGWKAAHHALVEHDKVWRDKQG
ncbi:beta-N-acetylhexosaminidase [Salinivibrio sp. ES.052]|uniref:beta-N-acetylhexosaminidase n=1 Tax=Salinivibrio sp. ES.052 TaxID=1882823 RepID=UPI00092C332F|nr:beta-N-acetylhexosaminidase [Salinivibrio sp. ES.052]SIO35206.1 beta-N-acetylhexosaminidase [Salinivibrio sp. ES.052]